LVADLAWNVARSEEKSQGEPVTHLGFSFIFIGTAWVPM
jgi:hypothetical protein